MSMQNEGFEKLFQYSSQGSGDENFRISKLLSAIMMHLLDHITESTWVAITSASMLKKSVMLQPTTQKILISENFNIIYDLRKR